MKDPKERRVLCMTLIKQEKYPHIRKELLMCPESFETNNLATEVIDGKVDNTGGQILRCRYWKDANGFYSYYCEPIKKISDLESEGLLAIFVLSELNRTTQDVSRILRQLAPSRHHFDHEEFDLYHAETWASRAFVDLAAFRIHDEPCFNPKLETYHREREIDAEVYRMSIHIYNLRSLVTENQLFLVPLATFTHVALAKPQELIPNGSIVSTEVQAKLLLGWLFVQTPPMVRVDATTNTELSAWVFDLRSRTYGWLANDLNA